MAFNGINTAHYIFEADGFNLLHKKVSITSNKESVLLCSSKFLLTNMFSNLTINANFNTNYVVDN